MPDERKTVGMLRDSKKELFTLGHPVVRQLREIPGILFSEEMETLPSSAISLKKLFSRKQMDENHVDLLILYRIAAGVLQILMALAEKGICPGLIETSDFYVELQTGGVQVYLTHPEKFQLLHYEQDYEWYPEDERLFGNIELFDAKLQRKADVRLIYKILVASAKGNVKMPPKYTEADYSELFYKALPDEWKQLFAERPDCEYKVMEQMLSQCIEMEESFAREARERLDEKIQKNIEEQVFAGEYDAGFHQDGSACNTMEKRMFAMVVLLRTELEDSRMMSQMLYQLQDELETEATMSHWNCQQAFVFGSGSIAVKEFTTYPVGFRSQCEQEIKDYSAGEALIIAANLMWEAIEKYGRESSQTDFRMYALADGRLKNDRVFRKALSMLENLRQKGMKFYLLSSEDSRCEACQSLGDLMQGQNRGTAGR